MEVTYKKYSAIINVHIKTLDTNRLDELKDLYISLWKYFYVLEENKDIKKLHSISLEIEKIEYKMQEIFGFKPNKDFHRYWRENPICTCPKLDNQDYYGTNIRLYNYDCPLHGKKMTNFLNRHKKIKNLLS